MLWAVRNVTRSTTARVALQGEECGWPQEHVENAVRACNRRAREESA